MKAIISGAGRGIGKASALKLAKEGYHLILISRTETELERVKQLCLGLNSSISVQTMVLDLSEYEKLKEIDWNINDEKELILINNAAQYTNDLASGIDSRSLKQIIDLNLLGSIELSKSLLPHLKKAKRSLIVNIGSVNALQADKNAATYSISKHALKGWTDALREELRADGIKVSAFYPGAVNTSSWDGLEVDRDRMIQSEDIAELIYSLSKMSQSTLVEEIKIAPLYFSRP